MPVRTSPRFVGRDRELATVANALAAAAEGRATTLFINGTAGIGASRLLDESVVRLAGLDEPFTVLRGRAWPGAGEPYGAVAAAFDPALARLADDDLATVLGPAPETLAGVLPCLDERLRRLGLLPERPWVVARERRQARLLEGLLGVLERLGERAPVVLALEDLHVADAGTRALVTFLARVTRPGRFVVIGSYEGDELTRDHPWRRDLAAARESSRRAGTIDLGPLDQAGLAELVAAIEGERPRAALLLLVAERSGGNPLIAEELLAARSEISGVTVAGSFEQLVMGRLAQRTLECRRVLRILAGSGAPMTILQLASVSAAYERFAEGRPPRSAARHRRTDGPLAADLEAGLAEAIEAGFVVPEAGRRAGGDGAPCDVPGRDAAGSPGSAPAASPRTDPPASPRNDPIASPTIDPETPLRIRHQLVARGIVSDLLPAHRRRLEAALGAGLRDRPFGRLHHLMAAHDIAAARSVALEAADAATSLDSPRDALAALELAIELGPNATDREARREVSRLLARAAEEAHAGDLAERAVAFAEAAIARLGERADRIEMGLLHDRLARFRWLVGDGPGALAAHERAVDLVPPDAPRERALVLAGLAQALMLDGQFAACEVRAREAIEVARSAGGAARVEEGHAICTLGIARAWGEHAAEAPALLDEARRIGAETRQFDDVFRAVANATTALDLLGARDRAIAVAREGIDEARSVGLEAVYGNFIRGNLAGILFLAGRWAEARDLSQRALEWTPSGPVVLDAEATLATIDIESRADEAAAARLGRLLLTLETHPDPQFVGPASQAATSFALWRGDVDDAARSAELGWSIAVRSEDWLLVAGMAVTMLEVLVATAAAARERRDLGPLVSGRARAIEVMAAAEAAVRRVGAAGSLASRRRAEASLATARALAARLDGLDDPSAWEALARLWERVGEPYQVARARWRQAQAALGSNDARSGRRIARAPLREAVGLARSLGARPLLREIEELAERALIPLPEAAPAEAAADASGRAAASTSASGSVSAAELVAVATSTTGHEGAGALEPTAVGSSTAESLVRAFAGHPAPRKANVFELSGREREVLGLIVQGRTNREIGRRLFISEKTVGVHVGNVLAKMRVSGRVEAATVAIRLGLADAPTD